MVLVHHIAITHDDPIRKELESIGYRLDAGFTAIDVEESDERWPCVAELISVYSPFHTVYTRFSSAEIASAGHLRLLPARHHGYPQPEDNFGYKSITYDDSKACPICWCGLVQKAPFKLHKPRWGRNSILQVNWVFDEYFVRPDVWEAVLKPLGIASREVLHSRTGKQLDDILQIDIPQTDIGHTMGDLPYEVCETCGTKKFLPVRRGFFPALQEECDLPIFRTREYFGSGGRAFRAVVVSHELSEAIRKHKLKGVAFYPLKEISERQRNR